MMIIMKNDDGGGITYFINNRRFMLGNFCYHSTSSYDVRAMNFGPCTRVVVAVVVAAAVVEVEVVVVIVDLERIIALLL